LRVLLRVSGSTRSATRQQVDGRAAPQLARGGARQDEAGKAGVDRVPHDVEEGGDALHLVERDER